MTQPRRLTRRAWLAASAVGIAGVATRAVRAQLAEPRTVQISARRFAFTPAEVRLAPGERVRVVVTSHDFVHGMSLPELGKRYDLVPGKPTVFELQAQRPGVIEFVCDNFCGDGHEEMHGRFVVG